MSRPISYSAAGFGSSGAAASVAGASAGASAGAALSAAGSASEEVQRVYNSIHISQPILKKLDL